MENEQILNRIFMIAERLIMFDGLDDVFEHIARTAVSLTHAEAATIRVFDLDSGTLQIVKATGVSANFIQQSPIYIGDGITGEVVQTGKPISLADVTQDSRCINAEFAVIEGIHAILCVPMKTRNSTIGCITVYRKNVEAFADHDLLILSIFASEAVEAVEKAKLISELKKQASYDSLTGLFNKRAFLEKLQIEVSRSQRHNQPLSVLFMDLDNFKIFNDTHGHLLGDKMLHDLTHLLKQQCRKMDIIGRFGGDEFVIIAPQNNEVGAIALAEKLLNAVASHGFITSNIKELYYTTCSIGVTVMPDYALTTEQLLNKADQALYASKRSGKGKVTVWHEGM